MTCLYPQPDFSDLEGWKKHLEWLRSETSPVPGDSAAIEFAEIWIRGLENPSAPQRPTEAA